MKTAQLTAAHFQTLLAGAEVWMFSSSEVCVSNLAQNEEFYFYYNTNSDAISDKGRLSLSKDQEETLKDLAYEHYREVKLEKSNQ